MARRRLSARLYQTSVDQVFSPLNSPYRATEQARTGLTSRVAFKLQFGFLCRWAKV
jgi:hypothetical protein